MVKLRRIDYIYLVISNNENKHTNNFCHKAIIRVFKTKYSLHNICFLFLNNLDNRNYIFVK